MAHKIEIVRGTTNRIPIPFRDANGRERTLADGEKLIFGIKQKLDDPEAIFVKNAVAGNDGNYYATIVPGDTEDLDPGKYFYDAGLVSGSDFYNIMKPNPFIIRANVTSRQDGGRAPEPVGYSYNGVSLPPIPDEIKAYSHIVIFRTDLTNDSGNYYRVFGTNAQMRTFESISMGISTTYHGSVDVAEFHEGSAYPNDTEWTLSNSIGTDGFNNYLHRVVWANYDVLNLDGTVYLAGSDPVPVYK